MIFANPANELPKKLVVAITGEPYQPARLYYEIYNRKTVLGAFKKLRCVEHIAYKDTWAWFYKDESRKLRFVNSYNQIPKEERPVLLGLFFFRSDREMILELDSPYHALEALTFFDKHINRRAARATRLRLVNRFFSNQDDLETRRNRQYTLDSDRVHIPDEGELDRIMAEYDDEKSRLHALNDYIEAKTKQPLPEIEEIPLSFYEDGIKPLELDITLRSIEARERWQGNNITQLDIMQKIAAWVKDDDEEE
jgi:hypothetical protein